MRRLSLATILLLALAPAGCGGGGKKSAGDGAHVFKSAGCGGCHTLAAARSTGRAGPNLDALKPDSDRVARQVRRGGNGMPAFAGKLSDSQIEAVADFVSKSAVSSPAAASAFHPSKTKVSGCGDPACYEQAFGNVAYNSGPRKALALLDTLTRSNTTVGGDCHRIAHTIGHAALLRYHEDVARAFAGGTASCASGYYHGLLERAFAGIERNELAPVARRLCADARIRRRPFDEYQCLHGLGHGLMIYTGYDLPLSLRVCDRLKTEYAQVSCTGGVFMENVVSSYGIKSKWVKDNDLLYPCDAVKRKHKLYCYLLATARILPAVGYNWRKTAAWCRRSERGWVATCFQSYGRDASGSTVQDPRRTLALCRFARNMEGECIYGASRDFANTFANGRRAGVLCGQAPVRYRPTCFYGIGTILETLDRTASGRRAACRSVTTGRYLRDCLRGAGLG